MTFERSSHYRLFRLFRLILLLVAGLLSAEIQGEPLSLPTLNQLEQTYPRFNGILSVRVDGKEEIQFAQGHETASGEARIGPDTRFYIGALSKQFTSAAIHLLVARGKLALQDPIETRLDGLNPPLGREPSCTIGELLDHRCGLPGHLQR